jgi:uncharacterized protein (DUF1330 family)
MPGAYLIANVDVTDPAQYEEYKKLSSIAMKTNGAEICIRGGKVEVLEGDWNPARFVMLKFPSVEAAHRFYESPEYKAAKQAREGAANMQMIIVEGT